MDPANRLPMNKKQKAGYYALKMLTIMISWIPRKIGLVLFTFIGRAWFFLDRKNRAVTIDNLSHAFADSKTPREIKTLARNVFIHFSVMIFEFLWSRNIDLDEYDRWFQVEGRAHFEKARQKNKGLLLLTAHMGIWELLTFFLAHEGLTWNSVYNPSTSIALDQLMADYRLRFGARKFPIHEALQHIMAAMERKEPVPLLMDLTLRPEKGVVARFFGRRLIANKGMAMLALQTEAPVIPFWLIRTKTGYKVIIKPEIPLQKTGDFRKDIEENTQAYNTAIEEIAREYPEQYNWIYKRWKHRPYSLWPIEKNKKQSVSKKP
jgi:Kdo2-lipid IVA lauroyltransferase/acyltransferase